MISERDNRERRKFDVHFLIMLFNLPRILFTYLDVGNRILASPILASPKWWNSNFVTLCALKVALLFVNAPRSVRSEYVTNSPGLELKLAHLLSHARRKVMRE